MAISYIAVYADVCVTCMSLCASITSDRPVLCAPSVLCFLLECLHLDTYAVIGGRKHTQYRFYNIVCFYMLSHMPSLLCGCWRFSLTLCLICSLMVFYIFCGVSSSSLYDFSKSMFSNVNFLEMHLMKTISSQPELWLMDLL